MLIEEVPFKVFLERNPHLKNRPLNEQTVHYVDYLNLIKLQREFNINRAGGIDFLLQENGSKILQEDHKSGILIKN